MDAIQGALIIRGSKVQVLLGPNRNSLQSREFCYSYPFRLLNFLLLFKNAVFYPQYKPMHNVFYKRLLIQN